MLELNNKACSAFIAGDLDRNSNRCARTDGLRTNEPVGLASRDNGRINDDCAVLLGDSQSCTFGVADIKACELDRVCTRFCRSIKDEVHHNAVCVLIAAGLTCPDSDLLVVIECCFAGITVCPLDLLECQFFIIGVLHNEACGTLVAGNGDRNLNLSVARGCDLADCPVGLAAGRDLRINDDLAVRRNCFDRLALGVGDFNACELDRVFALLIRCNEVEIHDNTVSVFVAALIACPDNNLLVVIDGSLAGITVSPINVYELQLLVISKLHNKACGAFVIGNRDRNLDRNAACNGLLTDNPVGLASRRHSGGRCNRCGRNSVRSAGCRCRGRLRGCCGNIRNNLNFESVEHELGRLALVNRNNLVVLRSDQINNVGAFLGRSLDFEGCQCFALVDFLNCLLCPCVNNHAVLCDCLVVEFRRQIVCVTDCTLDILNLAEVEVHLDAGCTLIVGCHPVHSEFLTCSHFDHIVRNLCFLCLGVGLAFRNQVVNNAVSGRLNIRSVALDDDLQTVEADVIRLGLVLRNDLVDFLGVEVDVVCALCLRNLDLERSDCLIHINILNCILCPGVNNLAALVGVACVELRCQVVCITNGCLDDFNILEVQIHLDACGTRILGDLPVNRQGLAGLCGILVVSLVVGLCIGILAGLRNDVINNGVLSRNRRLLLGGLAGFADGNLQTVEADVIRLGLILRNNLIDFLGVEVNVVCAVCLRNLDLERSDCLILINVLNGILRPGVNNLAALVGVACVELRRQIVCITDCGLQDFDILEVQIDLHTCRAGILGDLPVNRQGLARLCGVLVVSLVVGLCIGILAGLRNDVINNRVLSRNRRLLFSRLAGFADGDLQTVEADVIRLGLILRNDLVDFLGVQINIVCAVSGRNLDLEGSDCLIGVAILNGILRPSINNLTALVGVAGVELRCQIISITDSALDELDVLEVQVHLDTGSARILGDLPVNRQSLARLCGVLVVSLAAGLGIGIGALGRNDVINNRVLSRNRRLLFSRLAGFADGDLQTVEADVIRLGLILRNDLVDFLGVQINIVCAVSGRNLDLEGSDCLIGVAILNGILRPSINNLTALVGVAGVELRCQIISITDSALDELDVLEVQVHLDTGSARILGDLPVNRQGLARLCGVLVVSLAAGLCIRVGTLGRNDVIDNRVLARLRCRLFGGLARFADGDLQTVEHDVIRLVLILRNDLVDFLGVQINIVCAVSGRNLDLEGSDCLIGVAILNGILRPSINNLTALVGVAGVELRCQIISITDSALDELDVLEVQIHLNTCGTRIILDLPVNRQSLARLCGVLIVSLAAGLSIRIGALGRNDVVDYGIGTRLRCRLLGGLVGRRVADNDVESVELDRVRIILVYRNDLVLLFGIQTDGICAVCRRNLYIKAADSLIGIAILERTLRPGVYDLAALVCVTVIELRCEIIGIADRCFDNLNFLEVEVNLNSGRARIILDDPVNRQIFTRSCLILVVSCAGCCSKGLAVRNQIVNDLARRICLHRNRSRKCGKRTK